MVMLDRGQGSVNTFHPSVRSALFVPGNRRDWMDKAIGYGADALTLDLEDAVPEGEKDRARQMTAEFVSEMSEHHVLLVRVNGLDTGRFLADVSAVVGAGVHGVVIPKVETPADIAAIDRLVGWLEIEHGRERGSTVLSPSFETATAIRLAYEIGCASPRIGYTGGVAPRGGDVEQAVGYRWTRSGAESSMFRAFTLLSLRAAAVHNPISGLWTDVTDIEGLRMFASHSRDLGYEGMFVIHPSHVEVVNEAFSLSMEERQEYEAIIAALTEAETEGRAAITLNGAMIDIAMVNRARQRLGMADGSGS